MRNRILKTLALASCLFATSAVAQTTGSVASIASAPTVGGACYTGMAIFVEQSTGDHYTCIAGVWVLLPLGGGGDPWKLYKTEGGGSSSNPSWWADPLSDSVFGDADTDGTWNFRLQYGNLSGPVTIYVQDSNTEYVRWLSGGFLAGTNLYFSSFGDIDFYPDSDDSTGDEVKFEWPFGSGDIFKFTYNGLVFEGGTDDANEVRVAPAATLTGTRTLTLPDKTGGVVVLNGTTYPSPASPVCAEWQTDGRLGIAVSNAACGSGGSGDEITIDGTAVGPTVQFDNGAGADIDFFFIDGTPDIVQGNVRGNSIGTTEIIDNNLSMTDMAEDLALDVNDLINFSATTYNTSSEGLVLPQAATCGTSTNIEGAMCWDTDDNKLYVRNTSPSNTWELVGGAGDVTDVFNCTGPDCNQITMASGDYLRPTTAGFVGVHYTTTPDYGDGATCLAGMAQGDLEVDFTSTTSPEIFVCNGSTMELLAGGTAGTGISVKENNAPDLSGIDTLDFLAGFDVVSGGISEADIVFDMTEVGLTANHIWMGQGPGTHGSATNEAKIYEIPSCFAANEKLSFHPGLAPVPPDGGDDQYWSCDPFSTSPVAISIDVDAGVVGDGVNPEVTANGTTAVYINPEGAASPNNQPWTFTKNALAPKIADPDNSIGMLGTTADPIGGILSCSAIQIVTAGCTSTFTSQALTSDADGDSTPEAVLSLDAGGLKIYLGEGSTTPAMALVAGGIDANDDGVADNLSTNGLNKSMPNYSESFTSQTSVTLVHDLRSANLVTVCYDGSDNQITPSSVSIGSGPGYDVTVTFSPAQTGRCVVNGGTNSKYTTSFSNQIAIVIPQTDIGMDPYAAHVTCYDNEDPRNRVEPDSVQIDDATLDLTINFAVNQTGRCVVS